MTTKIFLSTRPRNTILLLFGFALAAKMADAQPLLYTYVSLEARIAQAESVVHGTISHLSRTLIIPPGAYVTNIDHWGDQVVRHITERPDSEVQYRVTVKVDEIIKGPRRKTVDVVLQTDAYDKRPEQWTERQTAFVWFIGDRRQPNSGTNSLPYWNTIRLGAAVPGERRFSSDLSLFSMDFRRLDDASEILARARKFAKRPSGSSSCWRG